MLQVWLIFLCIGLGVLATAGVVAMDEKNIAMVKDIREGSSSLSIFQRAYLKVYLLAMMADWLQGPFVYALYESYGFSRSDNALLFVAGFGSSAIFGTFIGALADKYGRQKFAVLYCALYFVSCLTKHVNSFGVLMIGRITGGIATSLLFSVFDAWLVSENNSRGFDSDQLGSTFSIAIFGNSIVAIAAGQVGQLAADIMGEKTHLGGNVFIGGYTAPFDIANIALIVCAYFILKGWPENFGNADSSISLDQGGMKQAVQVIREDPLILYTGIVCSCFEASMFIFVFNWTPCVQSEGDPMPPFGHIFSGFMISCMLGSRLFAYLSQWMALERVGLITIIVAMLCHAAILLSSSVTMNFFAFLVFEGCVGMYFPMIGTLKGQVVPDELRSTIYNLYRVPLNVIVVLTLIVKLGTSLSFFLTTALLGGAAYGQFKIEVMRADMGGGDFQKANLSPSGVRQAGGGARELEMGGAPPASAVGKVQEDEDVALSELGD